VIHEVGPPLADEDDDDEQEEQEAGRWANVGGGGRWVRLDRRYDAA